MAGPSSIVAYFQTAFSVREHPNLQAEATVPLGGGLRAYSLLPFCRMGGSARGKAKMEQIGNRVGLRFGSPFRAGLFSKQLRAKSAGNGRVGSVAGPPSQAVPGPGQASG